VYETCRFHPKDARLLARVNETNLVTQAVFLNVQVKAESGTKGQKTPKSIIRANILASLWLGYDLLIPRGDTKLEAGVLSERNLKRV
jgi:hypothetical protein